MIAIETVDQPTEQDAKFGALGAPTEPDSEPTYADRLALLAKSQETLARHASRFGAEPVADSDVPNPTDEDHAALLAKTRDAMARHARRKTQEQADVLEHLAPGIKPTEEMTAFAAVAEAAQD